MPKITVVNPHHWMNADGSFPEPARVRSRMVRVAQFIEYGGPLRIGETRRTLVPCRWRPGGRSCPGFMAVLKQKDDAILCLCMSCEQDEFLIYEWQNTPWARGPQPPVRVPFFENDDDPVASHQETKPSAKKSDELLDHALKVLGSSLSSFQIRELISTSERPTVVLKVIMENLPRPPTQNAVERFLPVLMDEWNKTARGDLHGLSPSEMRAPEAPTIDLGRNRPCPCGSGKKFKRCCISNGPAN